MWRKYLQAERRIADRAIGKAAKFACVRAHSVIDAPLEEVYDLFTDNTRVHEYNEYCKGVVDLEWLDQDTKITHSSTGRPFCREFVTRVHYRQVCVCVCVGVCVCVCVCVLCVCVCVVWVCVSASS